MDPDGPLLGHSRTRLGFRLKSSELLAPAAPAPEAPNPLLQDPVFKLASSFHHLSQGHGKPRQEGEGAAWWWRGNQGCQSGVNSFYLARNAREASGPNFVSNSPRPGLPFASASNPASASVSGVRVRVNLASAHVGFIPVHDGLRPRRLRFLPLSHHDGSIPVGFGLPRQPFNAGLGLPLTNGRRRREKNVETQGKNTRLNLISPPTFLFPPH